MVFPSINFLNSKISFLVLSFPFLQPLKVYRIHQNWSLPIWLNVHFLFMGIPCTKTSCGPISLSRSYLPPPNAQSFSSIGLFLSPTLSPPHAEDTFPGHYLRRLHVLLKDTPPQDLLPLNSQGHLLGLGQPLTPPHPAPLYRGLCLQLVL